MLRLAEKEHYEALLKENQSNLKNSWRILKEVINKKKQCILNSKFIINNNIVTDKKLISEGFNSFFTNIGPTLANKIPHDDRSPTAKMTDRNLHSMFVEPVVEDEVASIIKSLKISSAGVGFHLGMCSKDDIRCIFNPTYPCNESVCDNWCLS